MPRTPAAIGDYVPAFRSGEGIPSILPLLGIANITGTGTDIDRWYPPAALDKVARNNVVAKLFDAQIHAVLSGSGFGGSLVLKLMKNGVTQVGAITIPTASLVAGVLVAQADLRDQFQQGIPLLATDYLRLDCTTFPTGTSPTIAQLKVKCGVEMYGVRN